MAKWIIDTDHSVAAFAIRHMMIANVRGQFNRLSGTIVFDPAHIARSSVELAIEVASITTGIKKRDEHLLSPDFFDAAPYPFITFKSASVEPVGGNTGRVCGDLTIHGVTREITFDAEYYGPVKDPFGEGMSMGFSASLTINREDYGITWNQAMEAGGVMAGKEVQLFIDLEADLAE